MARMMGNMNRIIRSKSTPPQSIITGKIHNKNSIRYSTTNTHPKKSFTKKNAKNRKFFKTLQYQNTAGALRQ